MVAFADDFSAAGKLKSLLQQWTTLLEVGPKFCYFPEPAKSWLITNSGTHVIGKELFKDTKIKITNLGKRFLGSVTGTFTFKKQYVDEIVSQWISEFEVLSQNAKVEPQAASGYLSHAYNTQHK